MLLNIEAERVRNGYTKEKFANKLGVTFKTYDSRIKEKRSIPSKMLIEMSKILNVDVGYLLVSKDISDKVS